MESGKGGSAAAGPIAWVGYLPLPLFLALALFFLAGGFGAPVPETAPVSVDSNLTEARPPRTMQTHPPLVEAGGFERDCLDCHLLFRSRERETYGRFVHRDVVLDHGINDACLNCHDRENRNLLRGARDFPVRFTQSELLCARCHGTTFRDWIRGIHGRTDGFWDETAGPPRPLNCTQCHDPHRPGFAPFRPLPGPRALRTGDPGPPRHEATTPLMRWHGEAADESPAGRTPEGGPSK
jgi:hypothetical protein